MMLSVIPHYQTRTLPAPYSSSEVNIIIIIIITIERSYKAHASIGPIDPKVIINTYRNYSHISQGFDPKFHSQENKSQFICENLW